MPSACRANPGVQTLLVPFSKGSLACGCIPGSQWATLCPARVLSGQCSVSALVAHGEWFWWHCCSQWGQAGAMRMLWWPWPCSRLIVPCPWAHGGTGSSQNPRCLLWGKYSLAGRWQDTVTQWMLAGQSRAPTPLGTAALATPPWGQWHCHQLPARGPPHGSGGGRSH